MFIFGLYFMFVHYSSINIQIKEHLLYFVRVCVFRKILLERLVENMSEEMSVALSPMLSGNTPMSHHNLSVIVGGVEDDVKSNTDDQNIVDVYCDGRVFLRHIYSASFEYIPDIYDKCRRQTMNETGIEIYDNFIAFESVNEINISGSNHEQLIDFFVNSDNNDDINEIKTIEDYLLIFNNSIWEVYALLDSVYRFRFISQSRFSEDLEQECVNLSDEELKYISK